MMERSSKRLATDHQDESKCWAIAKLNIALIKYFYFGGKDE